MFALKAQPEKRARYIRGLKPVLCVVRFLEVWLIHVCLLRRSAIKPGRYPDAQSMQGGIAASVVQDLLDHSFQLSQRPARPVSRQRVHFVRSKRLLEGIITD